jgi:hypothetical protein
MSLDTQHTTHQLESRQLQPETYVLQYVPCLHRLLTVRAGRVTIDILPDRELSIECGVYPGGAVT